MLFLYHASSQNEISTDVVVSPPNCLMGRDPLHVTHGVIDSAQTVRISPVRVLFAHTRCHMNGNKDRPNTCARETESFYKQIISWLLNDFVFPNCRSYRRGDT